MTEPVPSQRLQAPRPDVAPKSRAAQAAGGAGALLLVALGIPIDVLGGIAGQLVVTAAAWALALRCIAATAGELRARLIACLAIATAGELFLSLAWGLYDYRIGNVPPFVPPGHMLIMFLGIRLAARPLPRGIAGATLACAIAWALVAAWSGLGTIDLALTALLAACLMLARSDAELRLYVIVFWLTLALELYGTVLGCWTWRPREAWFGLTSANPPLVAGAFYCVLDLMALAAARAAARASGTSWRAIPLQAGATSTRQS